MLKKRPPNGSFRSASSGSTQRATKETARPNRARISTQVKNRQGKRSFSSCGLRKRAQQTGETVRETKYEANIAMAALTASGVKRYLPMPSMKVMGKNTTTVV